MLEELEQRLLPSPYLTVAEGIVGSQEYRVDLVRKTYEHFLHREPESAGLAYWVQSGLTDEMLDASFVSSPEYQNEHATGWLTAVYIDLLGRSPDAGGVAYWQTLPDPWAVGLGIASSRESERDYVRSVYGLLLHRDPASLAELDFWAAYSREQVVATVLGSVEVQGSPRIGGNGVAWLDRAYLDLLGRRPDIAGEQSWLLYFADGRDVLVNNPAEDLSGTGNTQSETTAAQIDGDMVVAFNDTHEPVQGSTHAVGWSVSADGGTTWTDKGSLPDTPYGEAGDPSLAADAAQHLLYLALIPKSAVNGVHHSGLVVFVSQDAGQSFQLLAYVDPFADQDVTLDKEWLAVNQQSGELYVAFRVLGGFDPDGGDVPSLAMTNVPSAVYVLHSTDGGVTWDGLVQLSETGRIAQGAYPLVEPDGTLYVFWWEQPDEIMVRSSVDRGVSFNGVISVATLRNTSGDLGFGFRSNQFPSAACSNSGLLAVTYADSAPGDRANIYLVTSLDHGATWSPPQRVNDDATRTDQWQPTLSILGSNLVVSWYDRRRDPNNVFVDREVSLWSIAATGVVERLEPDARLTDVPFAPVYGVDPLISANYGTVGDYDSLLATGDGFLSVWGDSRTGNPDVRAGVI